MTDDHRPDPTPDPTPDLGARLAATLDRHAPAAAGTPRPLTAVVRRSRQLTFRRRATSALATFAVVAVVALALNRPPTSAGPDSTVPDRAIGTGTGGRDGSGDGSTGPDLQRISALQPFESCDAMLGWIKDEAKLRVGPYGFDSDRYRDGFLDATVNGGAGSGGGRAFDRGPVEASANFRTESGLGSQQANALTADGSAMYQSDGTPKVSGTNTQEVGVDEPDVVKTDGRRLFTLVEGKLSTFTVDGADVRAAGTIALPPWPNWSYRPTTSSPQLLLAGDRLVILDEYSGYRYPSGAGGSRATGFSVYDDSSYAGYPVTVTTLTPVDVSDLAHPKLLDAVHLDGRYVDTRMVGTTARVVVSSNTPAGISFVYPSAPGDALSEQAATEANKALIDRSTIDQWVPRYRTGNPYTTAAEQSEGSPLLDCAQVRHPSAFAGLGMVSVLTVDLASGATVDPANAVGVVATGDRAYASTSTLYVSTVRTPGPSINTPGSITTPGSVPVATATPPEVAPDGRTAIHAFDITGSGAASYRGSGEVRGLLMNDFAMSEKDGFLRTATTTLPAWGVAAETLVSTLRIDGQGLSTGGEVGGLGRGEQVKAVRFVGDVGYVVTFRQVDPLYTIDLREPAAPKVVGELKVLGYSAYLHPVADGRILAVGQDATDAGRTFGTQVVLYDVHDPATPSVVARTTIGFGSSLVEQDYHAFLWWGPSNLAVIPVNQPNLAPGTEALVGAIGFTVGADGFTERARIVNPINGLWCPPGVGCVVAGGVTCTDGVCPPPENPIGDPIVRTIVVGDDILTVSRGGVQVSDLATFAPGTWVPAAT